MIGPGMLVRVCACKYVRVHDYACSCAHVRACARSCVRALVRACSRVRVLSCGVLSCADARLHDCVDFVKSLSVFVTNKSLTQIGEQNKDDAIKFLGIYIDRHLTWKKHINIICSKISKATFVINRVKHFLPHCALKSLYYTLIHSHMTLWYSSMG